MEKLFKLKENGTSIFQEFNAGFTTFLTMLYIVPVNAIIMSSAGMPLDALLSATALITIFATILNGVWSNTPVAMSVGMGLNAYFTFGLVVGMQIPWQTALGVVFLSGIIFVALSFTNFRIWVLKSIPMDLRRAISAGIGTFISFIGLQQMGIIAKNDATLVALGDLSNAGAIVGVIGLFLVILFWAINIKGSFILAIISTSIIAWIFKLAPTPTEFFSLPSSISPIFFELDIISALSLSLLPVIITFFITDLFDSLGTLSGVGNRANIFKEDSKDGDIKLQKTLEIDAVATVAGSLAGVSTTTAFAESASGVEAGGRTGLTAVFTGLLFLLTLFMLPFFKSIPSNAIYPVLVMVGVLMFSELTKINFEDKAISIAVFFIVILMPLTYSITTGLAFGFIAYFFVKLIKREFKDINLGIIVLAIISVLSFVIKFVE
ncbi:xanthine/uracil/vitamin C permease [Campylobacter blaseri]|uniref:Guanine permease n=1 Tax=Campylobacter blaseri TaxID=2042961 RepID=A0A2P8QYL1_9BACT|nr:NCS2 family permease [Campylobacter blaseri]PSM51338.1 guanine permease [Campylobacter blaseri]PSM52482.1 guanine permease [Campylobacter blaseri]QKF86187.1 xanthine/uracil/vitamin C permease [Campylobacter blaseri]